MFVGADRKGPLAAFVVIAIIAAILLVTSVRSQAATGWLRSALPSTPTMVGAVTGGLDQMVEQGTDLVARSADPVSPPPTPVTAPSPDRTDPTRSVHTRSVHTRSGPTRSGPVRTSPIRHHTVRSGPGHRAHHVGTDQHDPAASGGVAHHHGRHLGWTHGHGHGHDHGHEHGHGRHLGWYHAHRG
jgi:hypothetical protein